MNGYWTMGTCTGSGSVIPNRKKSLKETLSCPVCDNLPVAPVYGCQNGHIICEPCKNNVRHCAICRAERFNVRCLVVEDLLASQVLPCEYLSQGCTHPLMNGLEYTSHLIRCPFRPIECECKDGISCMNQLVPYSSYVDHLKDFHGATRTTTKSCFISCDMYGSFIPKYFDCFNHTFVLMSHRNQTRFWTWIALLENGYGPGASAFYCRDRDQNQNQNQNQYFQSAVFYIRLKLRYKLRREDVQFITSDVFTPSSPRDLPEDVLKSGRCLELNATTIPDSVPPCVWPQFEQYDEDELYTRWGYDVEIWEPSNRIVRVTPLRRTLTTPPTLEPSQLASSISQSNSTNTSTSVANANHSELNAIALPLPLPPPPPPSLANVNVTTNDNANASVAITSTNTRDESDQTFSQQRPEEPVPFQVPESESESPPESRQIVHPHSDPIAIALPTDAPFPLSNLQEQQQHQPQPHLQNQNPHLFQLDFDFSDLQLGRRWGDSCILGDEDEYSWIGEEDYLNELELDSRVRALLPIPLSLPLPLDHVESSGGGDGSNINIDSRTFPGSGSGSGPGPGPDPIPGPEPQRKRARFDVSLDAATSPNTTMNNSIIISGTSITATVHTTGPTIPSAQPAASSGSSSDSDSDAEPDTDNENENGEDDDNDNGANRREADNDSNEIQRLNNYTRSRTCEQGGREDIGNPNDMLGTGESNDNDKADADADAVTDMDRETQDNN